MNYTLWGWLVRLLSGKPHMVVSGYEESSTLSESVPYLLRWYLIPRNRLFNIYLHKFMRDDDDRALHDHPWASLSFLLRGSMWEQLPDTRTYPPGFRGKPAHYRRLTAPAVTYRPAEFQHRIELHEGRPAWTLFLTGPKVRKWGFWCGEKGDRFVPWEQFTDPNDSGKIGPGCGE